MTYSPFVLPYHIHSWTISKVVPYLQDICATTPDTCQMNQYLELAWEHWDETLADTATSEDDFIQKWAANVESSLTGIKKEDIVALYDRSNDKHNTEDRLRAMWKYGTSIGVSGAPVAFVNGVKLDNYPTEEIDWKSLIQQLVPAPKSEDVESFLY